MQVPIRLRSGQAFTPLKGASFRMTDYLVRMTNRGVSEQGAGAVDGQSSFGPVE